MFCVCLEDTLLCSLLVNSGHFWLTSTIVHIYSYFTGGTGGNQAWPPHGFMLVLCQTQEGCFSYFKCSSKGCALPPTSLKASNITSIESLLIIYHLKCQGTFPTFTQLFEILRIGVHDSRTWAPTLGGRIPPVRKQKGDFPPETTIFTDFFKVN